MLKIMIESPFAATRLPPTLAVKFTAIDPGCPNCRTTVLVLCPITLAIWDPGGLPSWSTSPAATPDSFNV